MGELKKLVRAATMKYSVRNRHRKADLVLAMLEGLDVNDVLLVGAVGAKDPAAPDASQAGIVERRLAENYEIKMSINVDDQQVVDYPYMHADVRDMPFEDNYVDFALANAIIEHVGGESDQQRMVDEMTRVARSWVITTPNKWFPIESHTNVVFLHWLPSWRRKQHRKFTRLLSIWEFRALLPKGAVVHGWPWSPTFIATYSGPVAVRRADRLG